MGLRREQRHLAQTFRALLLAVGGPCLAAACNGPAPSTDAGAVSPPDAPPDADATGDPGALADASADDTQTSALDAPPDLDAGFDAPTAPVDAGDPQMCSSTWTVVDASLDVGLGASDLCASSLPCGLPQGIATIGCALAETDPTGAPIPGSLSCWVVEGSGCTGDAFTPGAGGAVTIECAPCLAGGGRRPVGLVRAPRARGATALGAYLAGMAYEEAASVAAFARLSAELTGWNAPDVLVRASARAGRDEVRHARTLGRLAGVHGGRTVRARVRRARAGRALAALAVENAREGCVRETYGALVAGWQARHAGEASVRRAFARIAADETRHAALAWAVARWLEPRLGAADRARVARVRTRAFGALREETGVEPPAGLRAAAGLPGGADARALVDGLARALGLG